MTGFDERTFSQAPWEVVVFDENEGFALQAWYNPHEVLFNFTWDIPAYPEEFAGLLWKPSKKEVEEYLDEIYGLIHTSIIGCLMRSSVRRNSTGWMMTSFTGQ